jgi:hypothetical protein
MAQRNNISAWPEHISLRQQKISKMILAVWSSSSLYRTRQGCNKGQLLYKSILAAKGLKTFLTNIQKRCIGCQRFTTGPHHSSTWWHNITDNLIIDVPPKPQWFSNSALYSKFYLDMGHYATKLKWTQSNLHTRTQNSNTRSTLACKLCRLHTTSFSTNIQVMHHQFNFFRKYRTTDSKQNILGLIFTKEQRLLIPCFRGLPNLLCCWRHEGLIEDYYIRTEPNLCKKLACCFITTHKVISHNVFTLHSY